MKRALLCTVIFHILFTSSLYANGAAFSPGLHGAGVIPVEEKDIRMMEEEIIIDFNYSNMVKCKFVLRNLTKKQKSFKMGFPFNIGLDGSSWNKELIEQYFSEIIFNVKINKKAVQYKSSKSPDYSLVYLWDIAFKPKETKIVECEYKMYNWFAAADGDVMQSQTKFEYITHTGKFWAGKLAKASFKIFFDYNFRNIKPGSRFLNDAIDYSDMSVISYSLYPENYQWHSSEGMAEYTFYDWEPAGPQDDIQYNRSEKSYEIFDHFYFKTYDGNIRQYSDKDIAIPETWEFTEVYGENCIDDCDTPFQKGIINENLKILKNEYLSYLRNEIFARKGYVFKDQALQEFFEAQGWYKKSKNNDKIVVNDVEKFNIAFIKSEENDSRILVARELDMK